MAATTTNPTYKLDLTSSPHVHSRWSTKQAMWMVVFALIPSIISAVVFFGFYQLLIIAVSVGFAVGTEAAIKAIRKRPITIMDGSGIITGLLLALILPPNFNLAFTAIGSVVAIGIGKEIFGGLGYNIFNPALVGRAFLQASFPVPMTTWTAPNYTVDAVTTATPLSAFKFDKVAADLSDLFIGNIGGSTGETSSIAVLIGGIVLIGAGVVNWRVPVSMIAGILVFGGIFYFIDPAAYPNPVFHLFAGGFLFGALFMATDWVTSPLTSKGMIIYGLGIALVLVIIRLFGGLPEGVMYAILFMNSFVPLINRYNRPRVFGEVTK
ncbi:MAG: RnfABCDGE type electron transport complex subunit D [Melioribacteraceae bacterium]|nr:RnfABCDGE type electron transport complex subunit D [Melioribacteraceae bacterium]MCF8354836.1 RnfABCDGE type electron transport complex subunit D [Melioribacteraceae bacterium]MCF8394533.1 RnfABCDGE type electron transport complex subunit D [Melioribacteraceae bacterium]MCF8420192.1 RnfABCDGE type electron transport complex subunit D [Melioribacteraceae bacterium]